MSYLLNINMAHAYNYFLFELDKRNYYTLDNK